MGAKIATNSREDIGEKKVLPLRKLSSIDEFIEYFPLVKTVIVDGTVKTNLSSQRSRETERELLRTNIRPSGGAVF
jgi:hypothetical protein